MPSLRLALTLSKNPTRQDGSRAVWLRIHLDKRLYFNTGFSVQEKDWDKGKERVRRDPHTTAALHAIKGRAQKIYTDAVVTGQHITAQAIRDQLAGAPAADFLAWAGEQVEADAKLSRSSKAQHRTLLNLLRQFAGGGLAFAEITYAFIRQFENWMASRTTERGTPAKQSYVARNLGLLRRNINEAFRQGKIRENPFLAYKIEGGVSKRVWCTWEEVQAIAAVDTRNWKGKQHITKQIWLMQFYTGLRFEDAKEVRDGDFYMDGDARLWLHITPRKTAKKGVSVHYCLTGMFDGEAERFILRHWKPGKGRLLANNITNKICNQNLKKLAKAAGIAKNITTHSARHSCAMYLLNSGYSIEQVAGILGHTDIKTTQVYARLLPSQIGKRWDKWRVRDGT